MPNIRRFLVHRTEQKDGLSKFTRQNLQNFKNKCAEATSKEVMILDLLASEKFGSAISGKCPCITRAYLISSQPAIFAILLFLNCCFVVFCCFFSLVSWIELNDLALSKPRRGKSDGFWIVAYNRWTNIYELGKFQGWPQSWIDDLLEQVSKPKVGGALGDAMSINVLMRVLGRAVFCGGLVKSKIPDVWGKIPYTAQVNLPDELYKSANAQGVWT